MVKLEQTVKSGKKRMDEIDLVISHLYEDNITGKISDERYMKMSENYESEQSVLAEQIEKCEANLIEMKKKTTDLRLLLQTLREYTDITELNCDLVNRLIQRIEVHNNDKSSGHCHVQVDIYFTGAGLVDIPTEQEILRLMNEIRNNETVTKSA